MKKITLSVFTVLAGIMAMAQLSTPSGRENQKSMVRQYIDAVPFVEIVYNSPGVTDPNGQSREGKIWETLVPYGLNNLGFGFFRQSITVAIWSESKYDYCVFS